MIPQCFTWLSENTQIEIKCFWDSIQNTCISNVSEHRNTWIPNVFKWFSENSRIWKQAFLGFRQKVHETQCLWNKKVHDFPMFEWFSKVYEFKNKCFLDSVRMVILCLWNIYKSVMTYKESLSSWKWKVHFVFLTRFNTSGLFYLFEILLMVLLKSMSVFWVDFQEIEK